MGIVHLNRVVVPFPFFTKPNRKIIGNYSCLEVCHKYIGPTVHSLGRLPLLEIGEQHRRANNQTSSLKSRSYDSPKKKGVSYWSLISPVVKRLKKKRKRIEPKKNHNTKIAVHRYWCEGIAGVQRLTRTTDCPNCNMSPSTRILGPSSFSSFTNVPFRLPTSLHLIPPALTRKTEWLIE